MEMEPARRRDDLGSLIADLEGPLLLKMGRLTTE